MMTHDHLGQVRIPGPSKFVFLVVDIILVSSSFSGIGNLKKTKRNKEIIIRGTIHQIMNNEDTEGHVITIL